MNQKQSKKITDFFFELGMLKRQKHCGFALAGVSNNLRSLADHTARAAVMAYILAELEGVNPEKTATICLIHDFPEMRIGDHHKIASRYLKTKPAEKQAFLEQTKDLPEKVKKTWRKYHQELEKRNTLEGVVAKDADWLEQAVSAREYIAEGHKAAQNWIDNVRKALETQSAKKLLKEIEKIDPSNWWQGLKKMTYKKLKKR
ncbi:MAG: HD domain-containing protein [Patescibacteria group bacterium]|nr:HD domain-containing protein [Patescibacteria group bacterium]